MSALAHISGVPLEELLPLACGGVLLWPALRALASSARHPTHRLKGRAS